MKILCFVRSFAGNISKEFPIPTDPSIVYYEGQKKWDAPLEFQSRIFHGELFSEYLLNFRYYLVQLNEYSNGELLDKKDEISFVMMINKLQSIEDIQEFRNIPAEKMQEIISDSPDRVVKIIADILLALLLKINVPTEKAEDIVSKVREKKMGLLFENFEPFDIQEEWRKLDVAWGEFDDAKKELDDAKKEFDAERQKVDATKRELNSERKKLDADWEEVRGRREELKRNREEIEREKIKQLKEKM